MKTILIRTLSGAVYIALTLGSLIIHESIFAILLFTLNLLALIEFQKFKKNSQSSLFVIFIGAVSFVLTHLILIDLIAFKWIWTLALFVLAFNLFGLFFEKKDPISSIAFSVFSLGYITLPLVLLNRINIAAENTFSWYIICMFIIIWTSDTFAYLSGLTFGKHKLFERISPKKTWEGFFGVLIAAIIAGYLLHGFLNDIQLIHWLILSALISVAGVFGDLVESLFKRAAGIKDSGNIMPGHGGILDRIDSLLFVVPILYLYLQIIN